MATKPRGKFYRLRRTAAFGITGMVLNSTAIYGCRRTGNRCPLRPVSLYRQHFLLNESQRGTCLNLRRLRQWQSTKMCGNHNRRRERPQLRFVYRTER